MIFADAVYIILNNESKRKQGKRMEETMKLYDSGVYLVNGNELVPDGADAIKEICEAGRRRRAIR